MRNKKVVGLLMVLLLLISACNPYRGFKGVDKKGMKKNKLPSQELRQDYEKMNKRARRAYKKETKQRKKRLGTKESSTP